MMALPEEKTRASFTEDTEKDVAVDAVDAGFATDDADVAFDEHETKRILRKVDFRLIPFLSVLYL
jgi:hypothetical protein